MGPWAARLAAVLGWGPVVTARRVLDRYDAAGGSLLAGGLAYTALFAIVPLTLLLAGILGLVVGDEARRASVVNSIAEVIPPLRDLLRLVLDQAAGAAGAISILGTIALAWGASRFVVTFEDAMGRIFGGDRRRSFLARNTVGLIAVIGLIGVAVLGAVLAGLSSYLDAAEAHGGAVVGIVEDVALALAPTLSAAASLGLVYRLAPVIAPSWRAILPPSIVIATVLTVLTRIFVYLAPRLIGAASTIGALATAFAALAWLGLSLQAVLLGAAWVRERDRAWGEPAESGGVAAAAETTEGAGTERTEDAAREGAPPIV